jgi:hypothetical protein
MQLGKLEMTTVSLQQHYDLTGPTIDVQQYYDQTRLTEHGASSSTSTSTEYQQDSLEVAK